MLKEGAIRQWQKEKGIGRKMKIARREAKTKQNITLKMINLGQMVSSLSVGECQKGKNMLLCNLLFLDDSENILLGPERAN